MQRPTTNRFCVAFLDVALWCFMDLCRFRSRFSHCVNTGTHETVTRPYVFCVRRQWHQGDLACSSGSNPKKSCSMGVWTGLIQDSSILWLYPKMHWIQFYRNVTLTYSIFTAPSAHIIANYWDLKQIAFMWFLLVSFSPENIFQKTVLHRYGHISATAMRPGQVEWSFSWENRIRLWLLTFSKVMLVGGSETSETSETSKILWAPHFSLSSSYLMRHWSRHGRAGDVFRNQALRTMLRDQSLSRSTHGEIWEIDHISERKWCNMMQLT